MTVEPATAPLRTAPPRTAATPAAALTATPSRRAVVAGSVAVLCLAAVLLEAAVDVLPDGPVVWVLTPVRLVLGAGLIAVVVAGTAPPRWRTPLDPAVAVLLLAAAVATVLAGQDWAAWRGILTAVAAGYLVVGVRRAVPDSWAACALVALVGVAVAATVALRQATLGTATGFCRGALDDSDDVCGPGVLIRAVGTFANPNLLAAFLVLMLPLAIAGCAVLADRWSRLVGAAVVAVGYLAVLLTGSRGGVLAAVVGIGAFLVLRRPTRHRFLVAGGVAVVGLVGSVLVSRGSAGIRDDVWGAAVRVALAHPLGVGPGRAGPMLSAVVGGDEQFQHAHDLWLNWAVEAGVPGLLAAVAITVIAGWVAVRAARRGSRVAMACGAGLAGFAVMSLADHPANALRISLALWVVLGLLAAEIRVGRAARPPSKGRAAHRPVQVVTAGRSTVERSRSGSR